jgi:tRNA modification GTPase
MTGKGTGAISTILVFGDSAEDIIKKLFQPTWKESAKFETDKILLGTIHDGDKKIDQVTIGCEQSRTFAINCHGNPLLVEMIIQLLRRNGVQILSAEQLQTKILSAQEKTGSIAIEAKLVQPKAKTLEGTKIVLNQIDSGLSKTAKGWLENLDDIYPDKIQAEAAEILQRSRTAKLIIYGCKAVLTGPANSGKSSLLNCLAGRQKSIVTEISGTTRDWVTAEFLIDSVSLELTDTAGLIEKSTTLENTIEEASQNKAIETIEQADLILLVLDNSQNNDLDNPLIERIADKKMVTVLNKSDLPEKFDTNKLPDFLSNTVKISAKTGDGIDKLTEKILQTIKTAEFNPRNSVCFTDRQENLFMQLVTAKSKEQAVSIITELLNGQM